MMEPQSSVAYLYTVLDSHETDHWGWTPSPALELAIPDGVATEERIMRSKDRNQGYTFSLGIPVKANAVPEGSRTAFRSEGEQQSERSDAGMVIVE
jgi:hypothetical protein